MSGAAQRTRVYKMLDASYIERTNPYSGVHSDLPPLGWELPEKAEHVKRYAAKTQFSVGYEEAKAEDVTSEKELASIKVCHRNHIQDDIPLEAF